MSLKNSKKLWRIIAVCAFLILAANTIYHFVFHNFYNPQEPQDFFTPRSTLIGNILCMGILVYVCFNPLKFEWYGLISLYYAVTLLVDGPGSDVGPFMYVLTLITLRERGYLRKHTKIKHIAAEVLFIFLFSMQIRYGIERFVDSLMQLAEQAIIVIVIYFLLQEEMLIYRREHSSRILDLTKYPELTNRDKEWILLVLDEVKYDTIATQYSIASGTVKNRMRKIFGILGVPDRIGLMARYGGCTVTGID